MSNPVVNGVPLAEGIPLDLFIGDLSGDRRGALIGVSVFCSVVTVFCMAARMARANKIKQFRYDDVLLLLAGLSLISLGVLYCVSTHYGNGLHLGAIPFNQIEPAVGLALKATPLGAACIICAKTAVGGTLLHVDISKTYKIIILATTILAVLGNLQQLILLSGICIPTVETGLAGNGHCWPISWTGISNYVSGITNAVTDVLFVVTPLYFLRTVRLSNRDRIALQVLLYSMFLATAMSIAKVAVIPHFNRNQLDFTWEGIILEVLTQLEALFCVIAACLPAIRQLFSKRLPHWMAYARGTKGTKHSAPTTGTAGTGTFNNKMGGISVTRSTTTRFNALDGSVIDPDEIEIDGPMRYTEKRQAHVSRLERCDEDAVPGVDGMEITEPPSAITLDGSSSSSSHDLEKGGMHNAI